jgi:hypothetical protein
MHSFYYWPSLYNSEEDKIEYIASYTVLYCVLCRYPSNGEAMALRFHYNLILHAICGRSVGIVRSRTQATELSYTICIKGD